MPQQIKGLPPGATVEPIQSQGIQGLPPGATVEPINATSTTPAQTAQQPGFFKRLGQSLGIPTSREELQAMAPRNLQDVADISNPAGVAKKLVEGYGNQVSGNFQDYKSNLQGLASDVGAGRTNKTDALKQMLNYASEQAIKDVPILGPAIWNYGEDIQNKNYAGAAGGGLGIAGTVLGPKAAGKLPGILGRAALLGRTPEAAYESALKPSTTMSAAERARVVRTGLEEGVPVTQKGLQDIGATIDDINAQIRNKVAANPNAPVDPQAALRNLEQVRQRFATQVNPRADLQAIEAAGQEFAENNPGPIGAERAQALKQGTYRALGDKAYGELKGASIEAQKALARGLKDELARQFPELDTLNARDSRLLDLQDSLERAVGRIGNHQAFGIGTPIFGLGAKAITGSNKLAAIASVMKGVLDSPGVKSRLAIALSKSGGSPILQTPRIAAYAAVLSRQSQPPALPFLQPSFGSSAQSPGQ